MRIAFGIWDFEDLDATEQRFRARLEAKSRSRRAEVLTQLARVEGLRREVDAGERLIREAESLAGASHSTRARDLERGRLRRSCEMSRPPSRAREPANTSAIEIARDAGGKTLRALGRSDDAVTLLEQEVVCRFEARAETELRSALIVAVPKAAAVVDDWRERTSDAKPSSGEPVPGAASYTSVTTAECSRACVLASAHAW